MASRLVTIYATCELTPSFNHADTTFVKQEITKALNNDGWNINNVSVNYSASSLSFSNVFQVTIQANVDNQYSDEYTRQRASQIINAIPVRTNYGIYQTDYYPLFSSVQTRIVTNRVIDNITQITPSSVSDTQNAIKNLGVDNFLSSAGFTSPLVLGVLFVALFLYLKK